MQFYRAEESAIRTVMRQFETGLFSIADQAVKDAGFRIRNYPKEGYYDDNTLADFDCVKTLQTGRPDPYYHWAIGYASSGVYEIVDFFADRIITTIEWQENKSAWAPV